MREQTSNRVNKLMMTVLVGMLITVIYIGYLVIFPIDILDTGNVRIEPKTVKPGETVYYIVDYCKKKDAIADINIYLFNEKIVALPSVRSSRSPGCRTNVARPVVIPLGTTPGVHRLEIDIQYRFNPLHQATYHLVTPNFIVKE